MHHGQKPLACQSGGSRIEKAIQFETNDELTQGNVLILQAPWCKHGTAERNVSEFIGEAVYCQLWVTAKCLCTGRGGAGRGRSWSKWPSYTWHIWNWFEMTLLYLIKLFLTLSSQHLTIPAYFGLCCSEVVVTVGGVKCGCKMTLLSRKGSNELAAKVLTVPVVSVSR